MAKRVPWSSRMYPSHGISKNDLFQPSPKGEDFFQEMIYHVPREGQKVLIIFYFFNFIFFSFSIFITIFAKDL